MRRKFLCLAGLIVVTVMLGGCDKCGSFEEFNVPSVPKTCHANPAPS